MKRLFLVALVCAPLAANAGVARFAAKHVAKPAAKAAYHVTKSVAKAGAKVAY